MDTINNLSCLDFLMLIYHWIIYDIEPLQQPIYIEMQPMTHLMQKQPQAQEPQPQEPQAHEPQPRQRKYVCSELSETPVLQTSLIPELIVEDEKKSETSIDLFDTDFEIIEIADCNKEE
jgi:hypothetical protein